MFRRSQNIPNASIWFTINVNGLLISFFNGFYNFIIYVMTRTNFVAHCVNNKNNIIVNDYKKRKIIEMLVTNKSVQMGKERKLWSFKIIITLKS